MEVVDSKHWFKPMEVAKMGLIKNSRGAESSVMGNYNFILELIKSGRLKAKNYSPGSQRPYYLVSETEIEKYHSNNG